jgi:hypothetical protein
MALNLESLIGSFGGKEWKRRSLEGLKNEKVVK